MKKTVVILLILLLAGCKTKTVYIPVESVRTEYKDKYLRDSIYMYDSIFVKIAGDTVFFEKYKYLYRDQTIRDSIFKTDSIQVPYPVTEYKEVNVLTSWQHFQIWCGRILVFLLISYFGVNWLKKFI